MRCQVKTIDECLKLHGLLCPPEFIPFHEALVKFFRKNFHDEMRRLAMDGLSDYAVSNRSTLHSAAATSSQYVSSSYEQSLKRSVSSVSTTRFALPSINVGRPVDITTALQTPPADPLNGTTVTDSSSKQTPLQRHLAQLARHGMNGVSASLVDNSATSPSTESPHNSFVHVGSSSVSTAHQPSGASGTSYMGSLQSFGSIKGRLSRFGSLSLPFGRKGSSKESTS
jgi:dedicator of cytokinesis protein 3